MLRVVLHNGLRLDERAQSKWRSCGLDLLASPRKGEAPDVILVAVADEESLRALPILRKKFPRALIVAALAGKEAHPFAHPAVDDFLTLASLKSEIALHVARWERMVESKKELIELREQVGRLSTRSEALLAQMERDLSMATEVQRTLFPKDTPIVPGVSVAAKYLPAAGMGGDYYDIFEMGDRRLFGLLLADSKTHGMAAALLSVLLKTSIDQMKDRFPSTPQFIEYLNHGLNETPVSELAELSVLYAIVDRSSLTLRLTSAGNLKPLIWRKGELLSTTWMKNPALGNLDHFAFRETEISLQPGDRILFFTDGLEAPLREGKKPLTETLEGILRHEDGMDALGFQNEILARIYRFKETQKLKDDLTFLYLTIDEKALYLTPHLKTVK